MTHLPRGVIAPLLTPFEDDLSVARDLFVGHARRLLDQGCAGLAPFGTTGEALSLGVDERIEAFRALVDAGIPAGRMIPGTGLTSLADTVRISRACLALGAAAVMTLPPFFYKGVGEDGLHAYFAALVAALGPSARICLYHIPQVAGVGLPVPLVARLKRDFPGEIVAIKDSSGDWENTVRLLEIPGLLVYPGTELALERALPLGAPGCISASANLNAPALSRHFAALAAGRPDEALADRVRAVRLALQGADFIAAQKRVLALATGEPRWANVRPPLDPMPAEPGARLRRELGALLDAGQPA